MALDTNSENPALLRVEGLVKTFGPVKALAGVELTIRSGEIHALLGENGAGKSTTVKCITGVYEPNRGKIILEGKEIRPNSTRDAENIGISTVYQEVNLLPNLSVEENITLGRQKTKFLGMIERKSASLRAESALEKLGVKIDLKRQLSELPVALQQMVALARALDVDSKVLILDEPTASLDENEVQQLFEVMNRLRDKGIAIVFITHFLDQVFQMSDRVTVLRNGAFIAEHLTRELSKSVLLSDMIGKSFEMIATEPKELPPLENGEVRATRLSVSNVERMGMIKNLNLDILEGEVVGLAGLLGSGRTECARLIFGIDKPENGSVHVSGKSVQSGSPSSALANGIMLASEDRKTEGIFPNLTVLENIVIALQARRGMLNRIRG
ncbi:MAG: sugar ABC transporter ATP-binding protein, partial [Verrucomicrobiota bacterium]